MKDDKEMPETLTISLDNADNLNDEDKDTKEIEKEKEKEIEKEKETEKDKNENDEEKIPESIDINQINKKIVNRNIIESEIPEEEKRVCIKCDCIII